MKHASRDAPAPAAASSVATSPAVTPKPAVQLPSSTLARTFNGKPVLSLVILTTTPLTIRFFTFKGPALMFYLRLVVLHCWGRQLCSWRSILADFNTLAYNFLVILNILISWFRCVWLGWRWTFQDDSSPAAELATPTLFFPWLFVYCIISLNQLVILETFRLVASVCHTIALRAKMSIGAAHMCHGRGWSECLSMMK